MPVFVNFKPAELTAFKKVWKRAGDAMIEAQTCYIEDDLRFRRHFKTWFGKTTPAAIADVAQTLAYMSGEFERYSLTVVLGPPNSSENANVQHFETKYRSRVAVGGNAQIVGVQGIDLSSANKQVKDSVVGTNLTMTIRPQMMTMPFDSLAGQSQVETLLHELSHFAAGTIDYNPPACYDLAGVAYCNATSVDVAVRNAENVGFFITSFLH